MQKKEKKRSSYRSYIFFRKIYLKCFSPQIGNKARLFILTILTQSSARSHHNKPGKGNRSTEVEKEEMKLFIYRGHESLCTKSQGSKATRFPELISEFINSKR